METEKMSMHDMSLKLVLLKRRILTDNPIEINVNVPRQFATI